MWRPAHLRSSRFGAPTALVPSRRSSPESLRAEADGLPAEALGLSMREGWRGPPPRGDDEQCRQLGPAGDLLPAFRQETGIDLQVLSVGSDPALQLLRQGRRRSSRRSTVMRALLRVAAVTTEYQRDSSSKRPRSSVVLAAPSRAAPVSHERASVQDCAPPYRGGGGRLRSFLGSGTAVLAAETTGRVCYGLDIDHGSPLYLAPIDERLSVAANSAAQRAIWPFDSEIPPDRQRVVAHDIDIAMDIGSPAAIGCDYPYRDGKPARVERCSRDGRGPDGHRASVERQQCRQAFRPNTHPLPGDAYSDDSIVLISQVAGTTDTGSGVVNPHTVEARDLVRQCDGSALSERLHGAAGQDGGSDQDFSSHGLVTTMSTR